MLVINGVVIETGAKVTTFRGETCWFAGIAQQPSPGKSGKVYVAFRKRDLKDEFKWSVFYPSVIGGEIVEGAGLYHVGIESTGKLLAVFFSARNAERFIDQLPESESGRYYIDGK